MLNQFGSSGFLCRNFKNFFDIIPNHVGHFGIIRFHIAIHNQAFRIEQLQFFGNFFQGRFVQIFLGKIFALHAFDDEIRSNACRDAQNNRYQIFPKFIGIGCAANLRFDVVHWLFQRIDFYIVNLDVEQIGLVIFSIDINRQSRQRISS